jgi:hypothetical protein
MWRFDRDTRFTYLVVFRTIEKEGTQSMSDTQQNDWTKPAAMAIETFGSEPNLDVATASSAARR